MAVSTIDETASTLSTDSKLEIDPARFRHFGSVGDAPFFLITNEALAGRFQLVGAARENGSQVLALRAGDSLERLVLSDTPEPSCIIVVSPGQFLVSPAPEQLGRRKLIVLPCASTPTEFGAIAHFLDVISRSDPDAEARRVDAFFELGQASEQLVIVNDRLRTRATFDHLSDDYEWNVQAGPLEWGDQQIAPSGELSVCPGSIMSFEPDKSLAINGEIALDGPVTIHNGFPSYLEDDRKRLHQALSLMQAAPLVLGVSNGIVKDVRASTPASEEAARTLRTLIEIDSRYAVIWECGFGINEAHAFYPGNVGMNEPYGVGNGCSHWGLGLTPYTQYALIIHARGTRIEGKGGECLIGSRGSQVEATAGNGPMRASKGACGCYPS